MAGIGGFTVAITLAHRLQRDRHVNGVAVAQGFQVECGSGLLLSDFDLQFTGVAHRFPIEFDNDVADFQTGLRARRVRFDLGDDRSGSVVHMEELRFFRRYVADTDADIPVAHLSILDETFDRGLHDLGGNGKSHAGETSGL
jgi:hypothetical protein